MLDEITFSRRKKKRWFALRTMVFFMPLDAKGKDVIVAGKAFVTVTSVEELRHYAEDAGKSVAEIAKITSVKKEFAFEASGVLLKVK